MNHCIKVSVELTENKEHPTWLDGNGLTFEFNFTMFAKPNPEAPDNIIVELMRLNGSRNDFAVFAQGLADKLGIVFIGGHVRPQVSMPMSIITDYVYTDATKVETIAYIKELLTAQKYTQLIQGLDAAVYFCADNKHAKFFTVDGAAENIPNEVVNIASDCHPENTRFHAVALSKLAALVPLEWCVYDEARAMAAAVRGVFGGYHTKREGLQCIVAMAKKPGVNLKELLCGACNILEFVDQLNAVVVDDKDNVACVLAIQVREILDI
jgi:hypothetical protein